VRRPLTGSLSLAAFHSTTTRTHAARADRAAVLTQAIGAGSPRIIARLAMVLPHGARQEVRRRHPPITMTIQHRRRSRHPPITMTIQHRRRSRHPPITMTIQHRRRRAARISLTEEIGTPALGRRAIGTAASRVARGPGRATLRSQSRRATSIPATSCRIPTLLQRAAAGVRPAVLTTSPLP